MRIFPIALIVIGLLGLAKYFGLIPVALLPAIGPLLLIALGVALLLRRRSGCRGAWQGRGGRGGGDAGQPPSAAA